MILAPQLVTAGADINSGWLTKDRSRSALTHPYAHLDDEASDQFVLGRSFFHIPWVEAPAATTARDGLGPLFNANSCASCHPNNGGGDALTSDGTVDRSIIIQLSQVQDSSESQTKVKPDPVYGRQLSINGTHEVPFEGRVEVMLHKKNLQYPDGTNLAMFKPEFKLSDLNYGPLSGSTRLSALRAPSLIGLGMIEQIPQDQIAAHADEFDLDQDGISGRINLVWSVKDQSFEPGRYGWKATSASVTEQTANALINDMGLTNPLFAEENCTSEQTACIEAYRSQEFDVPLERLQAISFYLQHIRKPRTEKNISQVGKDLFDRVGCASCHRTGYKTAAGDTVNPYSDFLLHDMGSELAAATGAFQAKPNEWRTPPLWGIGLARTLNSQAGYLHDGRASSLEQAIMWHGGEAAESRKAFSALGQDQRTQLIQFLEAL